MRLLLLMNGSRERYAGGADVARHQRWLEYCSPGTTLEIGYLPSEAESGGISKSYEFGTGGAMNLAVLYPERCVQAEREGYDGVIMHCCADPGLYEARKRVKIPVIGPGEITFRTGAMLGRKIGVTVPSDESLNHHREQLRTVGVEDQVIGIEPINKPIGAYAQQDPSAMTEAYVAAASKLVEAGAEVICPSGLAFIPVRVSAREVSKRLGVPVLDPAFLSVRAAEMIVGALPARELVPA